MHLLDVTFLNEGKELYIEKYTAQDIAAWLKSCGSSLELDVTGDNKFYYYLHYADGHFQPSIDGADTTLRVNAAYLDRASEQCLQDAANKEGVSVATLLKDYPSEADAANQKFWDIVLDTESAENTDFLEVCKILADDLNDYIEEVHNGEVAWERLISDEDGLEL